MMIQLKTLEEAKAYKYHQWAGNPNGRTYKVGFCAYEVWENMFSYQCSRKNGYGLNGLYCKQHSKKITPNSSEAAEKPPLA